MTSTVSVRIDKQDKAKFEKLCDSFGLTVSSAFNVFIKKVIATKSIPFSINDDPFYSIANQNHIKDSLKKAVMGKYKKHKLVET